ncbi:hypothetical protein, partial [Streptomyces sp. SID1121]|uniref:hypothetical protein n=1 Tax=Streptomyces sp. SID1121 TaxID=3425888 RepID=UPI00405619E3
TGPTGFGGAAAVTDSADAARAGLAAGVADAVGAARGVRTADTAGLPDAVQGTARTSAALRTAWAARLAAVVGTAPHVATSGVTQVVRPVAATDAASVAGVRRTAGMARLSDSGNAWVARVVALVRAARDVRTAGGDGAAHRRESSVGGAPGVVGAARVAAAAPQADRQPRCGKASDPDFPIDTRIHGGPRSYRPGDGAGTWYLDLTNTTADACHDIHPVIVLVDRARILKPSQVKLQMSEGGGRWRTLSLERSDEDETLGILDDGSPGFAVPAGRTVTVRARLTFAKGTRANTIEINSATVQRRGDDGDWVGKSNSYRFSVGRVEQNSDLGLDPDLDLDPDVDPGVPVERPRGQSTDRPHGRPSSRPDGSRATDRPADNGASTGDTGTGTSPSTGTNPSPGTSPGTDTNPGTGAHREETPGSGRPPGDVSPAPALPEEPELAATGPGSTLYRTLAAGALLAVGGVLFGAFRRLRSRRG